MRVPTFIVGTGRCGSTLLSNLLRQHPDILSLSEFFSLATDLGGRIDACFPSQPMSAEAFLGLVAARLPKTNLMYRHDVAMDEVLYRPAADARYTVETGVPAILQTTLPHLSHDPEALFDEVCAFLRGGGVASAGDTTGGSSGFCASAWKSACGSSARAAPCASSAAWRRPSRGPASSTWCATDGAARCR